jgi:hypothetical protein
MNTYKTTAQTALILACLGATVANAQAVTTRNDPFEPLVANWRSDATFTSLTNERNLQDRNSEWTGKFYGLVKPSGQLLFKGLNGCVMSGYATLFASNGLWSFNGQLEGCEISHFNQKVFGNLRKIGNNLILEAADMPFTVGKPAVAYKITATMTAY